MSDTFRGRLEAVADEGRAVPAPVVHALVELTERALAVGLAEALAAVVPALADAVDASALTVELNASDDTTEAEVVVEAPDAGLAAATAAALRAAVASAQRALATRADDTAGVDELRALARLDELTGALSRRALFEEVDNVLARSLPAMLVLCDLDGLKRINDTHGHPIGDAALRAFVDLVSSNLRASDVVGRIGGDEFVLLLPGANPAAVTRILGRLTTTIQGGPPGVADVRASFGTARFPDDGTTRDELVATADRRLYEHKLRHKQQREARG